MTDRERLRGLAEAATPGPWEVRDCGPWRGICRSEVDTVGMSDIVFDNDGAAPMDRDAAFIAACSPSVVLGLLAELERAESRIAELEAHINAAGDGTNLVELLDLYHTRMMEAQAQRDARPDIRTLPTEFVAGEWILSGQAEPDAVVTWASEPSPETGDVGWCWWAQGKMGSRRYYMDARNAAERALRSHAKGVDRV